jgi:branched-chain amino acid transport system permease protein
LVTLTFGFLIETLVFSLPSLDNFDLGVAVGRPSFARGELGFTYLMLVVFVIVAIAIVNLRRSTAGIAYAAMRSSDIGARTLGLNTVVLRVLLSGGAAFVAALGGGFLASFAGRALPASFATLGGLAWIAVLVTMGVRSTASAAYAGIVFAMSPPFFHQYLPLSLLSVPSALFGLGAIMVLHNPDGIAATHARQVRVLFAGVRRLVAASDSDEKSDLDPPEAQLDAAGLQPREVELTAQKTGIS